MPSVIVLYTHVVGLAVIRALGKMGVPVFALCYKDCEMGKYSKYVVERIPVPDPGIDEDKLIDTLLNLSSRFKGSLIIPTDDYTVVALSKNRAILEDYYIVGVERWEICRQFINKIKTYEIAGSLGIKCPATHTPASADELNDLLDKREIRFPCLLKPNQGHTFFDHFKVKMLEIKNPADLLEKFSKLHQVESEVMVQQLIPGKDDEGVNYNAYFVDGKPVEEFTAKKVRIEPPFFGSPRVIRSKKIPEILEPGRLLMNTLGYTGFACIEFKRNENDGMYYLMEVNCRNNLTGSLAVKCGINFPWIMYKHYVHNEFDGPSAFEEDLYWIDISHDLMRFLVSHKEERYSLRQYLKPYFSKKTFAVLSLSDPMPFIMRLVYLFKLGLLR
jgi:predicted ATP-grasp superfamily ATP-dependent carboligase